MLNELEILTAIASVLNGNPTEHEQLLVNRWLSEDEKNKTVFENLANSASNYKDAIDEEAGNAKEKIFRNIKGRIETNITKPVINIWKYVAAASIIIAIALAGINLKKEPLNIIAARIETKSSSGSTSKITLGDGTVVELNAGSEMSYPAFFNGDTRVVALNGEAYFEVAKDAKRPFLVETGDLTIEVLGTHFNVNSYEEDENIITTLLEGSVGIRKKHMNTSNNEPIILKPNQQLVFNKRNNSVNVRNVDADLYAAWKDGQYLFESEKFSDIVKKLERGFGVDITIQSPELEQLVFSGVFTKSENVKQILNALKKHRDFDYKEYENGIVIFKK